MIDKMSKNRRNACLTPISRGRSITNAFGHLTRVDEPDANNQLGDIDDPNQPTNYNYDTLNNLLTVTQGAQTRTFEYDALSRLKSATNPESGTITYAYDSNGNLTSKTDARSITTSYTYDGLNRVTRRDYSDSTPDVDYYYDNVTNAKGKLIKVSSSVSTTEYTAFDILGRVTGHRQTTGGTAYNTGYTYDLAGALVEETYPSGRKVKNTLDANGGLSLVETKPSGGAYQTRASNFTYNAAGAVSSMQLGNGNWESTQFNPRLQPTQIALGTTQNATDLLKLEYGYGTTANNGNVLSQKITVPGLAHPFEQAYAYDSLNRIASATETYNSTQTWTQVYGYDRYGNRNITSGTGATSLTFGASNNRITTSGYTYDSAGNTTADPTGRSFVYDAENKQTSVSNGGTLGTYFYDGDGKRVKKTSPGDNTIFVYDAAGRLVEEYLSSSPTTVQTAYVYAGSRLLSTEDANGTNYLTADYLGSPRINTDGSGNVVARHDYLPFGEEIDGTGGRTTALGYGTDSVRKQFTGYERDSETGLDYAEARMFGYTFGRFTSPDPIAGLIVNPQSHNKYAYAWNNPLILTDPTGLIVSWEDSEKKKKKGETEARTDAQRAYEKRLDEMVNSDDKKTREKGLKLKATYEKLQKSDITFHVVKENPDGSSSGELTYKGEQGHLYVNLKGDSNEYGALPLIQKLGHEFKHGEQFLDGQIGFAKNPTTGKWVGYRDDNVDEAEAWIAGFDAQPAAPDQRGGTTGTFVNSIANAYPFGVDAVAKALNESSGTYKGRGVQQLDIKESYWQGGKIPPSVYAVPRK